MINGAAETGMTFDDSFVSDGSMCFDTNQSKKSNIFKSTDRNSIKQKQFKIICVGESMVGKTSLIQRFIED
jgi:GTPase SAR1 family protein